MSIKKNILYNGLLSVSQIIFPLVTFPYATRVLGPEKLGLVNFADAYCKYFILIAALSIPIYGVREIAKRNKNGAEITRCFSEIFTIHLITTLSLLVIYFISIFAIPKIYLEKNIFLWGASMLFMNLFTVEWFFAGMNQFKYIAIRTFSIRILFIIFFYVFVKEQTDYPIYFGLMISTVVLTGLTNIFFLFKNHPFYLVFKWNDLKKHIKPILWLFSAVAAISIYTSLDTVILGFLVDDASVGYYSSALRINRIAISVIGSFSIVVYPRLTQLYAENKKEAFTELVNKLINLIVSFAVPVAVIFFLYATEIVQVVAGHKFEPAIMPFKIMCLLFLFISLSNIFGNLILISMAKDKQYLIATLIAAAISLLFNFGLIPVWKENGASIANLAAEITITACTYWFARKYVEINFAMSFLWKQLAIAIPYILIIFLSRHLFANIYFRTAIVLIFSGSYFIFSQLLILKNELFLSLFQDLKKSILKS